VEHPKKINTTDSLPHKHILDWAEKLFNGKHSSLFTAALLMKKKVKNRHQVEKHL
jgi:hypothetical protein